MSKINTISRFKRSKPAVDAYEFNKKKRMQCVVCKEILGWRSIYLWNDDCIRIGKVVYVIPQEHHNCKEIFNLNPLAYE